MGFVQVEFEVIAINSSAYSSFNLDLTNIAKHCFLIFIFNKSGQQLRAEGMQVPNLTQVLSLR